MRMCAFSLERNHFGVDFFSFFLLGTQPYKETCGDKHKTRHRGCRDDVPMYREQLNWSEVSALALQPGIEKGGGGLHGQVAKIILWCEKGALILHQIIEIRVITKPEGKKK